MVFEVPLYLAPSLHTPHTSTKRGTPLFVISSNSVDIRFRTSRFKASLSRPLFLPFLWALRFYHLPRFPSYFSFGFSVNHLFSECIPLALCICPSYGFPPFFPSLFFITPSLLSSITSGLSFVLVKLLHALLHPRLAASQSQIHQP